MSTTEGTTMNRPLTLEENRLRHVIADAIVVAFTDLVCTRAFHTEIKNSDADMLEWTGPARQVRVTARTSYLERCCKRCGCGFRVTAKRAQKLVKAVHR